MISKEQALMNIYFIEGYMQGGTNKLSDEARMRIDDLKEYLR